MRLSLYLACVAITTFSCQPSSSTRQPSSESSPAPLSVYIQDDSLAQYLYKVPEQQAPVSPRGIHTPQDFPQSWVRLDQTLAGPVIYHRNNRPAYTLDIIQDTLFEQGPQESTHWTIMGFEPLPDNVYKLRLGPYKVNSTFAEHAFKILQPDTMLALHHWQIFSLSEQGKVTSISEGQDVLIPRAKQHLYYHIDEPNTQSPDTGINFLNMNIDSLWKKYVAP